jgi:hypothetical protein
MTTVLVAGLPRSGTSWISVVLAAHPDVSLVSEPDNHWSSPFAFRAKRALPGRFHPALDSASAATDYERLWREAAGISPEQGRMGAVVKARRVIANRSFRLLSENSLRRGIRPGGTPLGVRVVTALATPPSFQGGSSHRVMKSVYATLCLEWIVERTGATPLILFRHPFNVISSWLKLGWLDVDPSQDLLSDIDSETLSRLTDSADVALPSEHASALTRATFLFGLLARALQETAARNTEWPTASHEALCAAPHDRIPALAAGLGIPWSRANDRAIASFNRPGGGYSVDRLSGEQIDSWCEQLSAAQVSEIESVLTEMQLGQLSESPPA